MMDCLDWQQKQMWKKDIQKELTFSFIAIVVSGRNEYILL